MKYRIGFDIGGTKCAVILGCMNREKPSITDKHRFLTAGRSADSVLKDLLVHTKQLLSDHGLTYADIDSIGISCGGPLDSGRGIILNPPHLPGWENFPIVAEVSRATGIPCHLENDANACALAEWLYGEDTVDDLIFLTCGTGFGAGLILGGKLYRGRTDTAGEIGHVRLHDSGPHFFGKTAPCEAYCSGHALCRIAQEEAPEDSPLITLAGCRNAIGGQHITALAEQGDPFCISVLERYGHELGLALSLLIDLLNPQKIVLGSVFLRARSFIEPAMQRTIDRECLPQAAQLCRIDTPSLGESLPDFAALAAGGIQ